MLCAVSIIIVPIAVPSVCHNSLNFSAEIAFVVIASFFTQLVFAGNLAIGGQKLSEVENEIKRLEAENTTLKVEIAKEAALSNLAADAQKLGFEKPKQVIIPN